jgi:hypothetical protein
VYDGRNLLRKKIVPPILEKKKIPYIEVPKFCIDRVIKMPVNTVGFLPKPHIDRHYSSPIGRCFLVFSKNISSELDKILNFFQSS